MGTPQGDPPDLRDTRETNLDRPPPPIQVSVAPPPVVTTTAGNTVFSPSRVAAGGTMGHPLNPEQLWAGNQTGNSHSSRQLENSRTPTVPEPVSKTMSVESAPPPLLDLTEPEQLRGVVGHSPDTGRGSSKSKGTSAQPPANTLKAPKANATGAKKKANPLKEKRVNPPSTTGQGATTTSRVIPEVTVSTVSTSSVPATTVTTASAQGPQMSTVPVLSEAEVFARDSRHDRCAGD